MLVFTIVEVRLPTTTKQKGKPSLKLKLTNSYKRLGTPDHDKAYQDKAQPYQSRAKHSLKMQFEKGSTCLPYHCGDKAFHDYKTEWVRLPSSSSWQTITNTWQYLVVIRLTKIRKNLTKVGLNLSLKCNLTNDSTYLPYRCGGKASMMEENLTMTMVIFSSNTTWEMIDMLALPLSK